jgi:hypothetical protein
MNASQLADYMDAIGREDAAAMLRAQHAAIRQLRTALQWSAREMHSILWDINKGQMPFDGDSFHETLALSKAALAATENIND